MLRVAREIFALLPVDTLLVTAEADSVDPRTGERSEQPVLSVAMSRDIVTRLDFDRLDPSQAIGQFQGRGDFEFFRKSEVFQPITPLTPSDLPQTLIEDMAFHDLLANVQKMREQLKSRIAELSKRVSDPVPQTDPSL